MTAKALAEMTDAGKFEILATAALRELHPSCKTLAHFGVNQAGKTIPNSIDGFCKVPGSNPPQYVMTAFTTCASAELKRKWFLDPALGSKTTLRTKQTQGDLIKDGKEATGIQKGEPTAKFIVYLCTNQRIDHELMQEGYRIGGELGLEVCFLEQSQLRDFLDTKPEGQWLRQQ